MFNSSPVPMRKGGFACVALLAIFGGLFVLQAPMLIWLYFPGCLAAFGYSLNIIYVSERFIDYAQFCLVGFLGSLLLLNMQGAYGVGEDLGWEQTGRAVLAMVPLALAAISYLFIRAAPPEQFPFLIQGQRVSTSAIKANSFSGLFAGASVLGSGIWLRSVDRVTGNLVVMILSLILMFFLLHYYKDVIRGLRVLREKEKANGVYYTFANIEELRGARAQWWLGRLFKAIFKGPG